MPGEKDCDMEPEGADAAAWTCLCWSRPYC